MGKNWKSKNFKGKQTRYRESRNHNQRGGNNDNSKQGFQRHSTTKYSREPIIKNNLKENEVGIEEFTDNLPGFTGIIKARFSDFHVNEIDLNGREVKLTKEEVPTPIQDDLESAELEKAKQDLKDVITSDMWNEIDEMIKSDKNDVTPIEIDVTNLDKEMRTLVHKTVKRQYGGSVNSTTFDKDDKKFIKVQKGKGDSRNRWLWPGEYTYFVIHKENVDTIQAASDLAQILKLKNSCVNYAGTKDKRAKTSQLFCIKKREPSRIMNAVRRLPYLKIGNFEFHNKVLKLGELQGNRFRIALRHVTDNDGADDKIVKSLENLQNNGFINYYGLQRFGNCAEVPTYKIGIALLKSDFKEACELILKPRENEHPILKEAREVWWKNRNSAEASAILDGRKCIEKYVLSGLADYGENDYATSLKRIPRNMLLMYTHSFQSFIWNKIASRRIKEFGLKVIPGDLIYREDEVVMPCYAIDAIEGTIECDDVPNDDDGDENLTEELTEFKAKVRPLTEDDISSGKYTIFDIVLPLPGYDITYPSNVVGKWYEEMLNEYDLTSEKLHHKVKTYALAGSYRKLIIKPKNMKWEFKRYNSSTSTLIASDYEELKGIQADDNQPDGKFKALILDFILPASTYATMALRELLKCDTSSSNQSKLMEEEEQKCKDIESTSNECENQLKSDGVKEDEKNCNEVNQNSTKNNENKSSIAVEKRKISDNDQKESNNDDIKKIKLNA